MLPGLLRRPSPRRIVFGLPVPPFAGRPLVLACGPALHVALVGAHLVLFFTLPWPIALASGRPSGCTALPLAHLFVLGAPHDLGARAAALRDPGCDQVGDDPRQGRHAAAVGVDSRGGRAPLRGVPVAAPAGVSRARRDLPCRRRAACALALLRPAGGKVDARSRLTRRANAHPPPLPTHARSSASHAATGRGSIRLPRGRWPAPGRTVAVDRRSRRPAANRRRQRVPAMAREPEAASDGYRPHRKASPEANADG